MAIHQFVKRDPDKGYFGRQLWLPKKHINTRSVKSGLEFPIMDDRGMSYMQLWCEDQDHIIVPREFITRDHYKDLPFPIVSVQPLSYPQVEFKSNIVLDFKEPNKTTQRDAFADMETAQCGILNLSCGAGKTALALHYIAKKKVPALVIVNNTTLIDQWQDRIQEFLHVPGGVGTIQGPPETWDWQGRGICVAMIHSLALRSAEVPLEMARYFGLVIYDEVHHLSAPLFSQTAPLFFGERHGLTATNNREDGLEVIYQYHVGEAYHCNLMQDMRPRIYFQQCPVSIDTRDPAVIKEVYDKAGKLNIPKLRNYLGSLPEVNDFIAEKLRAPIAMGRKILVLSHSVGQLRNLNEMFEDAGLCTGKENPKKRLETLRTKQLSFGTLQLVREALDESTLDTLFFVTPFGSQEIADGGLNTLQQGMGRIQRFREGKKTPVVVILDHIYIPKMHRMCSKMKRLLKAWPAEQGGALEYTTLRPYSREATNGK
jgi:superfamily II DNA or RNA helicase